MIRHITPEQSSFLAAAIAEAEARGMRRAAEIATKMFCCAIGDRSTYWGIVEDAIEDAIQQGRHQP